MVHSFGYQTPFASKCNLMTDLRCLASCLDPAGKYNKNSYLYQFKHLLLIPFSIVYLIYAPV